MAATASVGVMDGLLRDRGGAVLDGFGARGVRFLIDPFRISRIASCGSGRFFPRFSDIARNSDTGSGSTVRFPSRQPNGGFDGDPRVQRNGPVQIFLFIRRRIPWLMRAPAYVPDRICPSAPGRSRSSRLCLRAGVSRPLCRDVRGPAGTRRRLRQHGERVARALDETGRGRFPLPGGHPEHSLDLRTDVINLERRAEHVAAGAFASRLLYSGRGPDRVLRHQLLASIHFASNSRLL